MFLPIWIIMLMVVIPLANTGMYLRPQSSNICNDAQINALEHKLELAEVMNQNLQLKFDDLKMSNYQLLTDLKTRLDTIDAHIVDQRNVNSTEADSCSSAPTAAIPHFCKSGQNGIQLIQIPNSKLSPFYINCMHDLQQDVGPWILIQRRRDGNIDFNRDWSDYEQGFGNLEGDFFIGLSKLHALTQATLYELWIKMVDSMGDARWAKYSSFAIGDENQAYALNILGNFTGNAGDSLTYHAGQKFSTKNRDNDDASFSCASRYDGAWWFKECRQSNLNGKYLSDPTDVTGKGIAWDTWTNHNPIKYVHMALRPMNVNK